MNLMVNCVKNLMVLIIPQNFKLGAINLQLFIAIDQNAWN